MARGKKQKWEKQVEDILKSLGVQAEQEIQTDLAELNAALKKTDAMFDIFEHHEGTLVPPDPWADIFKVLFRCLLRILPAEQACQAAFMIGELWKIYEGELLKPD